MKNWLRVKLFPLWVRWTIKKANDSGATCEVFGHDGWKTVRYGQVMTYCGRCHQWTK